MELVQAALDGLLFGTTYALIGIGFTLVFGVMHKINLSYAAASIAGAYVSLAISRLVDLPVPIVYLIGGVAAGALGYLIYLTCFRYIPVKNPLATLMSSVGMLILLDEVVVHETDGIPQSYPPPFELPNLEFWSLSVRPDYLVVFGVSVAVMVVLMLVLYRTRLGIATRAVAQQPVAAQLCGISVQGTNASTFVIAGVIGGIAGAMIGAAVGMLAPQLTLPVTVKGLIVTVIGGLGSIPGAIVAGLLVGALEEFFKALWDVNLRDMAVLLLLYAFLVLRPSGLFGKSNLRD
ncbi:MAG: branched-chain amino acid ABC transporter permease [Alphaproteobacteria bacterium]